MQAAHDPRRWLLQNQPFYLTAHEKSDASHHSVPKFSKEKNCNTLACMLSQSEEKMAALKNKELKKKEKLATESLPQLMPDALKALSSANSQIIKDCLRLQAINDKFPAMDRSLQLAESRDKLRAARSSIYKVTTCLQDICTTATCAGPEESHSCNSDPNDLDSESLKSQASSRNFVRANASELLYYRTTEHTHARLLQQAIATEAKCHEALLYRTVGELADLKRLNQRKEALQFFLTLHAKLRKLMEAECETCMLYKMLQADSALRPWWGAAGCPRFREGEEEERGGAVLATATDALAQTCHHANIGRQNILCSAEGSRPQDSEVCLSTLHPKNRARQIQMGSKEKGECNDAALCSSAGTR